VLIDSTAADGRLAADVEGLAIAEGPGRSGYLVASSQGDSTFVIYRRAGDNAYVRTFEIPPGALTDGVDDTDGIAVTTTRLDRRFPHGLFVAQDGKNDTGNQNFKLVPWRDPVVPSADRAGVVRRPRD
jgi:3-phytase